MDRKRILIVTSGDLSSAGLVSVVSSHQEMEVHTVTASEQAELLQAIVGFRPEVLILDDAILLETLEVLVDLRKEFPKLRTVTVNWDENEIQVCDRQQILIAGIADFFDAL